MSAQHTPGPWIVETVVNSPSDESIAVRDGAHGLFIAMVEPHDMSHANAQANAAMIAAAPDMLVLLREALEYIDSEDCYNCGIAPKLRAVIAKAEGRS
jgi:hypothetical protein